MIRQLRHSLARRKRWLTTAALVLIALALAAGVWAGGGAGFTRVTTSTSISTSGSGASTLAATATTTTGSVTVTAALNINFKDTGLGNPDGTVTITGTVDHVSFFWQCINNGGNRPKATNKGVIEVGPIGPLSDTFRVDKNGNVTGTLGPFPASIDGSSFCPSGQQTQIYAQFVDVNLTDSLGHTFGPATVQTDTITY